CVTVADLAAHADAFGEWHEDQKATGERDLSSHARPLRRDGLLGNLNDQVLAALEDVLDGRRLPSTAAPATPRFVAIVVGVVIVVAFGFVLWVDEIRGV